MENHTSSLVRYTSEFLADTGTIRHLCAPEHPSSLPHPQADAPDHLLPKLLINKAERKRKL